MLLLRHDIAWHARLEVARLNPRLLYLAHSCALSPDDRERRCRALVKADTDAVRLRDELS